ncbi:hypothetical protein N4T57_04650 [Campylobacter hepaticus]|uniref:Periplasmic protein n=2 Tax=Campylobacter hepaticus TaxID=1813019 RepID=A0A6A7JRA0_9BACT|nr:hypothetical protein [Campylobacter hepaticus]AXP08594.1 hypothetical protein A2J15_002485 [Campylobacter hepaticus]MCZ0772435.1 hypothetical protein [Campylobacter hepaticus]MCZ0773903.1 hypothetical protein [Campylobacter hepaticus]MCZ0775154.1 hypothetical protein [Campylobacter hepaticus]MDX2323342.1 hypothetical protein [Campylobacter hepaticus]
MKKIILLFFNLYILSFANTYEKFNDFAYEKKSNKNFKIQELQLVTFFKNKQNCLEFLIEKDQIRIIKAYHSCQELVENKDFINFLNNDFLEIYKNNNDNINQNLKALKNTMQDIMIYYKLHYAFSKDIKDMSKNTNLSILNIDEKEGGVLLYKINQQACIGIELNKHNNKMAMKIYGIENSDKECKIFIQAPFFKELSYTQKDFKWYYLE